MRYLFHFTIWVVILTITTANDPKGLTTYGGFFGWLLAVAMLAGFSWLVCRIIGRVLLYLETGTWR